MTSPYSQPFHPDIGTLEEAPVQNNISRISAPAQYRAKEELYLAVRQKEKRLYDDGLVKRLPIIERDDPYYTEWEVRMIASLRLHKYLLDEHRTLRILDIGCGNGWLANLMTQVFDSRVWAIDVNMHELKQAARLFGTNPNLTLAYCDILHDSLPAADFDVIILAATIQYFSNLKQLIDELQHYLAPGGAIHIIDSPLYLERDLDEARAKTLSYYSSIGFSGMAGYYFHHTFEELKDFNYKKIYNPVSFMNKVRRKILSSSDSPFSWISIYKS